MAAEQATDSVENQAEELGSLERAIHSVARLTGRGTARFISFGNTKAFLLVIILVLAACSAYQSLERITDGNNYEANIAAARYDAVANHQRQAKEAAANVASWYEFWK
ncbi:MAG TPA: hypothetical protein ENH11_01350 [Candidatus Acetothermia bacterium]|nr:hypothetical protein [Candidatus Acetothermia bacterium]